MAIYAIQVDPQVQTVFFDSFDCVPSSPTTVGAYNTTFAGTGTVTAGSAVAGVPGGAKLATGTTSTGAAILSGNADRIILGKGIVEYKTNIAIPTLSTSGETFTIRTGLNSATDGTAGINAVLFEYSSATAVAGGMGGNWRGITTSATSSTTINGGTALAPVASGTVPNCSGLRFVVNKDASQVDFYVNNTWIGFSTTNIPSTALIWCTSILKSAGTTSRTMNLNYAFRRFEYTTPIA